MSDISGFGLSLRILASNTFPVGFDVSQFADDSDPLDIPELDIAEAAMGLNGDLVRWTKANPIAININLIAGVDDDRNMLRLFEANRAGRNKTSAKDVITMVGSYPSGLIITLTGGVCRSFVPAPAVSSDGRLKSKPYGLTFENVATSGVLP